MTVVLDRREAVTEAVAPAVLERTDRYHVSVEEYTTFTRAEDAI